MLFWEDIEQYKRLKDPEALRSFAKDIYQKYLVPGAELEININSELRNEINSRFGNPTHTLFIPAQESVVTLMRNHCWSGFVTQSQEFKNMREYFREKMLLKT